MASSTSKRALFLRCARLQCYFLVILTFLCVKEARCDPANCGNTLDPLGSGAASLVCGMNSECANEAICQCDNGYFSVSTNHTDCQSRSVPDPRCSSYDENCVYCGPAFRGPCQICTPTYALFNGQQCVDQCPSNTVPSATRYPDPDINILAVRICEGEGSSMLLPEWGIIVIVAMGAVILVVIAICITTVACMFLRRSSVGQLNIADREAAQSDAVVIEGSGKPGGIHKPDLPQGGGVMEDYFESDDIGKLSDEETAEFFSKLAILRTQAETFLKMLNDMRKRLKELPPTSQATQQYKDVMRDITRLLYILNKNPEAVRIPPDGIPLLDWSEQILNRYLAAQGKPTVDIRASNIPTGSSSAASNPNRISVIGDQATTHF